MTLNRYCVGVMLVVLLSYSRPASASVIVFSDFGADDSFSTSSYLPVSGLLSPGSFDYDWAMGFTPSADYRLDRIRLAAGLVSGSPADLYMSLAADAYGTPGAILESWAFSSLGSINGPLLVASSVLHPTLNAGVMYWLVADAPAASNVLLGWNATNLPSFWSFHALQYNDRGWIPSFETPYAAFEIQASPVPEPATLVLFGSGTAALAWRRRRSRPMCVGG